MKLRSLALPLLATLCVSSSAFAQSARPKTKPPEPSYGSVERTKLLSQLRGAREKDGLPVYGSVERRAALTGSRVQHLPERHPRSGR